MSLCAGQQLTKKSERSWNKNSSKFQRLNSNRSGKLVVRSKYRRFCYFRRKWPSPLKGGGSYRGNSECITGLSGGSFLEVTVI